MTLGGGGNLPDSEEPKESQRYGSTQHPLVVCAQRWVTPQSLHQLCQNLHGDGLPTPWLDLGLEPFDAP